MATAIIIILSVWLAAFRRHGRFTTDRREYDRFDDALRDAFYDPRALVYAVTGQGRSVLVPRGDWKRKLEMWRSRRE